MFSTLTLKVTNDHQNVIKMLNFVKTWKTMKKD